MPSDAEITREAKEHVSELAEETKTMAREKAAERVEAVRDTAAERVENTANAAHAAAGQFDPASLQAEAMRNVASHVEGFANRLRATDVESMARQTSDFARKNPLLFIGGAAVLGFVATRFLKSQPVDRADGSASLDLDDDPWGDTGGNDLSEINGGRTDA